MKSLVIFKTHVLNEKIIEEFYKLKKTANIDSIIYFDNQAKVIDNDDVIQKVCFDYPETFETEILCSDLELMNKLNLPMYDNREDFDYQNTVWYNSDYPLYVTEHFYPDYDYYWSIEYDVYSHADDYSKFFKIYGNKKSDALLQNFSAAMMYWSGIKGTDWVYKDKDIYLSFFPVLRLSKRAITLLRNIRQEHGKIYEQLDQKIIKNRWVFCEAFVPTECVHNRLRVSGIFEENIKIGPPIELRKFQKIKQNGALYHPIKERLQSKRKVKYTKVQND